MPVKYDERENPTHREEFNVLQDEIVSYQVEIEDLLEKAAGQLSATDLVTFGTEDWEELRTMMAYDDLAPVAQALEDALTRVERALVLQDEMRELTGQEAGMMDRLYPVRS